MVKINSLDELIKAIEDNHTDFFIKFGIIRSSKYITYNDGIFHIYNEIDDSADDLTAEQLFDEEYTNIGKAIKSGQFYMYKYD